MPAPPALTPARRYSFTFPRRINERRRRWPLDALSELDALPGVATWTAFDASQAWRQLDAGAPATESRTRRIDVDLVEGAGAEGAARTDALFALVERLRTDGGYESVQVTSWPVTIGTVQRR